MFKLQTKNLVEHFLEACSREERDDWAVAITAAVEKLRTGDGRKTASQEESTGSESHNINLR